MGIITNKICQIFIESIREIPNLEMQNLFI